MSFTETQATAKHGISHRPAVFYIKSVFEYDDLYQEGCILLCKAAERYNPEKGVLFSTFAQKVVINGLRTYCRLMCNKQKRMVSFDMISEPIYMDCFFTSDETDTLISEIDVMELLVSLKSQYTGVVFQGIEDH